MDKNCIYLFSKWMQNIKDVAPFPEIKNQPFTFILGLNN